MEYEEGNLLKPYIDFFNFEILESTLKPFTENEQQLILGEMSQWKKSRFLYREKFIDIISQVLFTQDIKTLKDALASRWRSILNINVIKVDIFNTGHTPLIQAILNNRIDIIEVLIANGVDLNHPQGAREEIALIEAASYAKIETVRALIDAGANVHLQDTNGNTALIEAASHAKIETVRALIAEEADVDTQNNQGTTALIRAVSMQKIDVINELTSAGANVHLQDTDGNTALMSAYSSDLVHLLISAGININTQNNKGETALIFMAAMGKTDVVKALIAAGADVNLQDQTRSTALMRAAVLDSYIDTLKELISAGAKLNLQDQEGNTALMSALRFKNTAAVRV